jgi:hypothetical protein
MLVILIASVLLGSVIVYVIWLYFLREINLEKYKQDGQENWALVTGASDGIGLGFCQVEFLHFSLSLLDTFLQ